MELSLLLAAPFCLCSSSSAVAYLSPLDRTKHKHTFVRPSLQTVLSNFLFRHSYCSLPNVHQLENVSREFHFRLCCHSVAWKNDCTSSSDTFAYLGLLLYIKKESLDCIFKHQSVTQCQAPKYLQRCRSDGAQKRRARVPIPTPSTICIADNIMKHLITWPSWHCWRILASAFFFF